MRSLSLGDEAPNFDLASTEDVLLMLRDECVRTSMVLYFFDQADGDQVRDDLLALARLWPELSALSARALGISRAALPKLKELQQELHLPFPLLHDDRGFAAAYGLAEATEETAVVPVLAAVDREQALLFLAPVKTTMGEVLPEIVAALEELPSPAAGLPRKVVNRVVDWWVN